MHIFALSDSKGRLVRRRFLFSPHLWKIAKQLNFINPLQKSMPYFKRKSHIAVEASIKNKSFKGAGFTPQRKLQIPTAR